ncbi:MAG: hypothetical protein R3C44_12210 [Chloroflexota bacterium]
MLHRHLTVWSGNPIYTLILNGFAGFYEDLATRYFGTSESRSVSRAYYTKLEESARREDADKATTLTRETMSQSIALWEHIQGAPCGVVGG